MNKTETKNLKIGKIKHRYRCYEEDSFKIKYRAYFSLKQCGQELTDNIVFYNSKHKFKYLRLLVAKKHNIINTKYKKEV